ncbi:MAG: radical SAM family heme chaperone HemW [Candidatus Omnitrophica bacterium]|nr:radical SAM family heme chaperone HemW [Candidatus Omnitrophota bacterium]
MNTSEPIGLYVHIPFCIRKCHYCNFVIAPSSNERLRRDYFTALEAEAAEARQRYGPIAFDTVYLGGGTPSALTVSEMENLFALLKKHFSWRPDAEVTCEVNPGEVDEKKFDAYRRLGVNRISLGVQSTNDELLRAMNRAHNAEAARRTAQMAIAAGFDNISMDLIIRLPNQKVEDVYQSLADIVEWKAQQLVVYDLSVHQNTQFGLKRDRGLLPLPSEDTHEKMFAAVEEVLGGAGFDHYEVSSFARPGYESKHNLIYWRNQPYLGLGPGAFSYMEGVRSVYAQTVAGYVDKALRADWSRDEEDILTPEDKEMETILTGLRLKPGIDMSRFPLMRPAVEAEIPSLAGLGLVEYDEPHLKLSRKGRYLAESVFTQLSRDTNP